ncbi:MAG: hypothetical protein ACREX3_24530 [Gammaproteobacteria bacterium]
MNRFGKYRCASVIVILVACMALLGIELVTRLVLVKISRVEARGLLEYESVVQTRNHSASQLRILLLGNSLLLEGVDFPVLKAALRPQWYAQRYVVDDTNYYDWYYGLRRLYREGATHDVVALVLTAQQLTSTRVRGSYFARRLMYPADFIAVARATGMHPTQAMDLFFSSISEFYGLRSELRKVLLGRLIPELPALAARFVVYPQWMPDSGQVYRVSLDRLSALRDFSKRMGTSLFLVIPPLSRPADLDGSRDVIRAGATAGVTVLMPIPSGTLPHSAYRDGFHLNGVGAKRFTAALANALTEALSMTE